MHSLLCTALRGGLPPSVCRRSRRPPSVDPSLVPFSGRAAGWAGLVAGHSAPVNQFPGRLRRQQAESGGIGPRFARLTGAPWPATASLRSAGADCAWARLHTPAGRCSRAQHGGRRHPVAGYDRRMPTQVEHRRRQGRREGDLRQARRRRSCRSPRRTRTSSTPTPRRPRPSASTPQRGPPACARDGPKPSSRAWTSCRPDARHRGARRASAQRARAGRVPANGGSATVTRRPAPALVRRARGTAHELGGDGGQ